MAFSGEGEPHCRRIYSGLFYSGLSESTQEAVIVKAIWVWVRGSCHMVCFVNLHTVRTGDRFQGICYPVQMKFLGEASRSHELLPESEVAFWRPCVLAKMPTLVGGWWGGSGWVVRVV